MSLCRTAHACMSKIKFRCPCDARWLDLGSKLQYVFSDASKATVTWPITPPHHDSSVANRMHPSTASTIHTQYLTLHDPIRAPPSWPVGTLNGGGSEMSEMRRRRRRLSVYRKRSMIRKKAITVSEGLAATTRLKALFSILMHGVCACWTHDKFPNVETGCLLDVVGGGRKVCFSE